MGGAQQPEPEAAPDTPLVPDDAHNNQFDRAASEFFYRRCQELGVPLIIVSRHAAYAVQMPRSTYDKLALTGSSIGFRLKSAQRDSIEQLWQRACAPDGSDKRKGLPGRCDRTWFLNTFCSGVDGVDAESGHVRSGVDPVWDLVASFNQYDTLALFAAVPALRAVSPQAFCRCRSIHHKQRQSCDGRSSLTLVTTAAVRAALVHCQQHPTLGDRHDERPRRCEGGREERAINVSTQATLLQLSAI